ncbi:hypothetical protein [Fictibacillus halophilus]|uniref:hypothetical protein n=1 Tax=Fictibacillus halophilus TaxID=1610490 RepID=UPI001CF9A630|nr:hypothetical protein [Fictibacillus halophilus]
MTKKTKKILFGICLGIILIPFTVNILLIGRFPFTNGDDWQGFFGDFFGAIIGGLTAFLLLQLQRDDNNENDAKINRSFVYIENYKGHYRLKGVDLLSNTKVIETEEYINFIKGKTTKELEQGSLTFYKIGHRGYGETIFNCKVTFKFFGIDKDNNKHPKQTLYRLPMLSKGEEIYLPFIDNNFNNFEIQEIDITYKTMVNEHIIFNHNLETLTETYYTTEVSNQNKIMVSPIKKINWFFPMQSR